MEIIDLSVHNGAVDFDAVRAAGVEGVMLRAGYTGWGSYTHNRDPLFDRNYAAATAAGLFVGAYYYSAADTPERAADEAAFFLSLLAGKAFALPAALDVENPERQSGLSVVRLTDIVCTFCEAVEAAGYLVSIYASRDWLENKLDDGRIGKWDIWLAQWGSKPACKQSFGMWQYTSDGAVNGVCGRVDRSKTYKDYPASLCKSTEKPESTVQTYQKWLNTEYDAGLAVDGSFGPASRTASVKALQTVLNTEYGTGLAIDGSFGPASRAAVRAYYPHRGCSGNFVRLLQGCLYGRGYDPGGFDGSFGPGCEAAVRELQKQSHIAIDGFAGPDTWGTLLK